MLYSIQGMWGGGGEGTGEEEGEKETQMADVWQKENRKK